MNRVNSCSICSGVLDTVAGNLRRENKPIQTALHNPPGCHSWTVLLKAVLGVLSPASVPWACQYLPALACLASVYSFISCAPRPPVPFRCLSILVSWPRFALWVQLHILPVVCPRASGTTLWHHLPSLYQQLAFIHRAPGTVLKGPKGSNLKQAGCLSLRMSLLPLPQQPCVSQVPASFPTRPSLPDPAAPLPFTSLLPSM